MTVPRKALLQVVEAVLEGGFRRATKVLSPTLTVQATRQHRPSARDPHPTLLLTIGRPNYAARQVIARCRKAKEPLPLKRLVLQRWPVKKGEHR